MSTLPKLNFGLILFIIVSWTSNAQNSWSLRTDFGGTPRNLAVSFSIGTKVYVGTGTDASFNGKADFWEYNTTNDTWTQKLSFPGTARFGAVGFAINGKGYIGFGVGDQGLAGFNDIWEYDPTGNTWTQKASLTNGARGGAVAFVVNNKAYVGTGTDVDSNSLKDFWEFDPTGNTWTAKANLPGVGRSFASAFAIGTKGYVGIGADTDTNGLNDFYEYDPSNDTWTQKANFGGGARFNAASFSIDTKGYIGTGGNVTSSNELWEYNPANNSWTQRASYAGSARLSAFGTSAGGKGYIGTGDDGANKKDVYEYTPPAPLLDQTISFNTLTAKTFGDANFNLTATASSSLPVTYTSSNLLVATVSGSTVTIVGGGTTTITASQGGNASYNPAPSVDQSLTINKANQSITFGTLASKTFGNSSFALTATSSSTLPVSYSSSNTSVATISGSTVTIVGAGTTTITANQSGNTNYNAATGVPQVLTVGKASQTISFGLLPGKLYGDANFNLTATASSSLAITYTSSNPAVATVSGNVVTILGAGTTIISAAQAGDANYNAATSVPQNLTVSKINQVISFYSFTPVAANAAPFTINASSTSGLAVTFTSSDPSVATVSGSTLTPKAIGTTVITASQAGNGNYNAATSVQNTLTVTTAVKLTQTITFNALPSKVIGDPSFTVSATSSASLPITFSSSNAQVASADGTTITINGIGQTIITAAQAGNTDYASASKGQLLTVNNIVQSEGRQGQLWGVTLEEGSGGYGTIFKTNSDGTNYTVVKDFNPNSDGYSPFGPLTLASNNKFYGITYNGGAYISGGTLYEFDPETAKYSKKFDFEPSAYPAQELTVLSSGKLFGITSQASITSNGKTISGKVVFEYDPVSGVLNPITDVSSVAGNSLSNWIQSSNKKIYGICYTTDNTKYAVIEYNPTTSKAVSKVTFSASINGGSPYSISFAPNGKIIGTCSSGGVNGVGFIFEYDTATAVYTKQLDFETATSGNGPQGLTLASNGTLYGVTNDGVVFTYDPVTHTYAKKQKLPLYTGTYGRLAETPEKKLLGLSFYNGITVSVFEFDPSNSAIKNKITFADSMGTSSRSGLSFYKDKFYGNTSTGGKYGGGTLFQYDYKLNEYHKQYNFKSAIDGAQPNGTLTLATNGKFYGTTTIGGITNSGVVYEFDPATYAFAKRADISKNQNIGYNSPGFNEQGTMLLGMNGKLYGTTGIGSSIFEFDPVTYNIQYKTSYDGSYTIGSIKQTEDGHIWGLEVVYSGSKKIAGLFEYDPSSLGPMIRRKEFDVDANQNVFGGITIGTNGKIYGTLSSGGNNNSGVIFEYDRSTFNSSIKYNFPSGTRTYYSATLVNGKLIGVTDGAGTIYEYDLASTNYTTKHTFDAVSGTYPTGDLLLAANGKLYGRALGEGLNRYGVIFEYDPATGIYTSKSDMTKAIRSAEIYIALVQANNSYKKEQTISFAPLANKIASDKPFTLAATSSSSLKVQFTSSSDKTTIKSDTATIVKPGKVTITASQPGNADYFAAPDVSQSICINPAKPIITLSGGNTDNIQLQSSNANGNQWFLNDEKIASATSDKFKPTAAGVYTVQSSVDGCIGELSDKFTLVVTGDIDKSLSITLYPNPTQETLYVTLPGGSENKVDIVRTDGRSLEQHTTSQSSFEVNVKSYAPGLYLLRVSHANGSVSVLKFVKQ